MIACSRRCLIVYRSYIIALYVLSGYAYFRVGRKCQSGFILRAHSASHVRLGFTSTQILFSPYFRCWDMISVFLPPGSASRFVCPFMISRTSTKERAGTAESPGDTTSNRASRSDFQYFSSFASPPRRENSDRRERGKMIDFGDDPGK